MLTREQVLQIAQTPPDILEWCENEGFIPRPEDMLWTEVADGQGYYPDYVISILRDVHYCFRKKFALPVIRLCAVGSTLGKAMYEKEIREKFGKPFSIEEDKRAGVLNEFSHAHLRIKQFIKEVDQDFLNKYPLGKVMAVASRYEDCMVKNEQGEETTESHIIISRIAYVENWEDCRWRENALKVWQKNFPQPLTDADLLEISTNAAGLFALLNEWHDADKEAAKK